MWWYISPPPGMVALTFPHTRSLELLATGCIGSSPVISDTCTSQSGQHSQLCQDLDWLNRQQQDSPLGLPSCAMTGEHSVVLQLVPKLKTRTNGNYFLSMIRCQPGTDVLAINKIRWHSILFSIRALACPIYFSTCLLNRAAPWHPPAWHENTAVRQQTNTSESSDISVSAKPQLLHRSLQDG